MRSAPALNSLPKLLLKVCTGQVIVGISVISNCASREEWTSGCGWVKAEASAKD
jgi:hypothetical protein